MQRVREARLAVAERELRVPLVVWERPSSQVEAALGLVWAQAGEVPCRQMA